MKLTLSKKILVGTALVGVLGMVAYLSMSPAQADDGGVPDVVDFNFHVRPILSDKCFKCHGPDANKREAGLRLDTEEGAFAALKEDPSKHVIVAGNPLESALYQRIIASDTSILMPPPSANLSLTQTEIAILKKWIQQGATYKKHWSFIAPVRPTVPKVDADIEPVNPIDNFIFAKLEEKGLEPSATADKETLLKRVSMDITGLPPSVELQDKFLNDASPDAYEKIVDELLKSRHYGEKMAIHWLDLARYADSHGYQDDSYRTMWPWRDWVIHAFNKNYPFSTFLTWQLAGDMLPNATKEQILATGFNRNHKITQEGGVIDEEYRIEYVTDRTNTFGKAFLALTLECSKCHDHKYDPISQKEYYSTFAFFDRVPERGLARNLSLSSYADSPYIRVTTTDVDSILTFINKKDTSPVKVMVMQDSAAIRYTRLLRRGAYDQPADTVEMATPASVLAFNPAKFERNRLGLARWMLAPEHPLTARVFANRLWNEFFGRGLVKTVGDFGMQGELPSHPELLDWLAVEFRESGWDIKKLVRLMVTSATYKQTTKRSSKVYQIDPENKYMSYYPRLRVSAELQRDLVLRSSGLLNPEIGGPSVKPYQPKGVWEATTSGRGELAVYQQDIGDKLYRRGLYTFIKRTAPPPALLIMDASTRDQCEVSRIRTNTPLQALVLMNDPQTLEASRVLAQRTANLKLTEEQKLERLFRTVVCRRPTTKEKGMLLEYYQQEIAIFRKDKKRATKYLEAGMHPQIATPDVAEAAALMQVNQMLYNIDETTIK